jgi:hypothetical protein
MVFFIQNFLMPGASYGKAMTGGGHRFHINPCRCSSSVSATKVGNLWLLIKTTSLIPLP